MEVCCTLRPKRRAKDGRLLKACGYARISRANEKGASLDHQRQLIEAECARRGWELVALEADVASAKSLKRPGIQRAFDLLGAGSVDCLVVAKLDRFSRSLLDFAKALTQAREEGWSLVCLDLGVDTSSASGKMVANVIASLAEYERELIGQRTKEALQIKRERGVRLGRPSTLGAGVVERIAREREAGKTLKAIAEGLNADHEPTGQGGSRWWPSSVREVLNRASGREGGNIAPNSAKQQLARTGAEEGLDQA